MTEVTPLVYSKEGEKPDYFIDEAWSLLETSFWLVLVDLGYIWLVLGVARPGFCCELGVDLLAGIHEKFKDFSIGQQCWSDT